MLAPAPTFHLFGTAHLVTIAAIAAVSAGLPMLARASWQQRLVRPLAIALAIVLLALEVGTLVYSRWVLATPWPQNLPAHLCDLAMVAGALSLLTANRHLFQLLYYWGLAGTLQAILTPDLPFGFPDLRYLFFFFSHGLVLVAIAYGAGALGLRATARGIATTLMVTHLWALLVAAPINWAFGTNYLYLSAKPAHASLMDAMGPWPWYLLTLELVGLASFFLYYAPWALAARWRRGARAAAGASNRLLVLGTLVLAAGSSGCFTPASPPAAAIAQHVVLVTLDTLRADHVGAYGSDIATPALDRIARQGALARHASAHVPLTRPSHITLMSGLLPIATGIHDNVSPAVVPDVPLLAEVLKDAGFHTAGFVSSVVLTAASGLGRGFDTYAADFAADPDDPSFLDTAQQRGDRTLAKALAWLGAVRHEQPTTGEQRIFLWLHLYDPHAPYDPPEPWASRYSDDPYAGEVAWTDSLVGQLDRALAALGMDRETLLVVTSDHGEGLGEHGEEAHGFFTYQSTLHVPMLLRGPGIVAGHTLDAVVGLIDLYPTILALAGVPAPARATPIDGRSLARALRTRSDLEPAALYAESLVPRLRFGWSPLHVLRDGRFKYIEAPRPELYDLVADPHETVNLVAHERRTMRALRERLAAYRAREGRVVAADADAAAAQAALREELAALGYLGFTPATPSDPGADPKDKIAEFRRVNALMRRGLELAHAGKHAEAVQAFEALRAGGAHSAELDLYLGRSQLALGQHAAAARSFQATLDRTPSYQGAWLGLAEALLQRGDTTAAEHTLERARAALPHQAALAREHGRLLRLEGKPDAASAAFEAGLALDANDAALQALAGQSLRDRGDFAGAIRHLQRATELMPQQASFFNVLGMTLANAGDLTAAEDAFRHALRLDASDPQYAFNLGLALWYQKRPDEARSFFTQAAAAGFAPAREQLRELGP